MSPLKKKSEKPITIKKIDRNKQIETKANQEMNINK